MAIATVDKADSKDKIEVEGNKIVSFEYMPKLIKTHFMNAGIYMFDLQIFNTLPKEGSLEKKVFPILAKKGKLFAFKFSGEWKHIDEE